MLIRSGRLMLARVFRSLLPLHLGMPSVTLAVAGMFALVPVAAGQNPPATAPQQPQRPPVFRAGANFVLVDAYPQRDGKIVEGLKATDFEVLEDGKPQSDRVVRVRPRRASARRRASGATRTT